METASTDLAILRMPYAFKRIMRSASIALRLSRGAPEYLWTGKTPEESFQRMIRYFCATGGESNDLLAKVISSFAPSYRFPSAEGILGDLAPHEVASIKAQIEEDGFYVSPVALDGELCDELERFARSEECILDGDPSVSGLKARFDPQDLKAVRYSVPREKIVNHPVIQKLICDFSLLSVAQAYLGVAPIADPSGFGLSLSTAFSRSPSDQAAQYFHFDMDRIKWLKVFIYLTDVTPASGPHTFIRGSHRTHAIPKKLLEKGYARLSDEEVASHFPPDKWRTFTGRRGTVILEDTRGLHKGTHLQNGYRAMLGLQYSNCAFGANLPEVKFPQPRGDALQLVRRKYPRVLSLIVPETKG